MWQVTIDGFRLAEFQHYCDAMDFVQSLPGSGSENAKIVLDGQGERKKLQFRLTAWKEARAKQIREARKTRSAEKWGVM